MSYEAPINILQLAHDRFRIEVEENVVKAVAAYDIEVNRKELIKALNYDRQQYQKGYEDGRANAMPWIPCRGREDLPKDEGVYLVSRMDYEGYVVELLPFSPNEELDVEWWTDEVDAWMPKPEPYKEDRE